MTIHGQIDALNLCTESVFISAHIRSSLVDAGKTETGDRMRWQRRGDSAKKNSTRSEDASFRR